MAIVRWVLIALTALAAAGSWWSFARADGQAESAARYYCPMHPARRPRRAPGECPICQMTLEPIPEGRRKSAAAPSSHAPHAPSPVASAPPGTLWTCPMASRGDLHGAGALPEVQDAARAQSAAGEGRARRTGRAPAGRRRRAHRILFRSSSRSTAFRRSASGPRLPSRPRPAAACASRPGWRPPRAEWRRSTSARRASWSTSRCARPGSGCDAGRTCSRFDSSYIYQAQSELLAVKDWPGVGGGKSAGDRAQKKLELLGCRRGPSIRS